MIPTPLFWSLVVAISVWALWRAWTALVELDREIRAIAEAEAEKGDETAPAREVV